MAAGRRRTDGPGTGRPPAAEARLSDHPTAPGRHGGDGAAGADGDPGRIPRTPRPDPRRLEPAAAASRRPPVPPVSPRRVGPSTTVAPFPVPGPEAQPDKYSPERLAGSPVPTRRATDRPSARTAPPSLPPGHPSAPVPGHPSAAAPVPAPARPPVPEPAAARATPWSTGARADRARPASAPLAAGTRAPVLPGRAGPHPSGPIYGDWTRPSRSGAAPETGEDRAALPPASTAIPERDTARGRRSAPEVDVEDDDYDDARYDAGPSRVPPAAPLTDPGTGPSTEVRGGRAADRAVRQVADEKRRKELKAQGETMTARAYLDGDDLEDGRSPRRAIIALVAVVIVALGVLGVYSFVSPATEEASSHSALPSSSAAPATGIATATLPELSISPPPVVADAPADAKAPVTVLNETNVHGLAGRIAGALQGAGWEAPGAATYAGSDVAATTVYYTDGDTNQQQAAQALVNQFPQIHGPAVRFFDVPGQADPGLVVVAAGDWQP